MVLGATSGRNRRCRSQRSTHQYPCHWERVYVYDTISLDRQLILRQHRMRRGFVLLLMVVIVTVPFSLGTILYRMGSLEAASLLFGFSQPPQQAYAYNDRVGRVVAPHATWEEHGHRWQSAHPGLKVFGAHYRHELGSLSKPVIRVTAIATPEFLSTCLARARVVYHDYPHSLPAEPVLCKELFTSPKDASGSDSKPVSSVLVFGTGQPADRTPVAVSIQAEASRSSTVWIAVNTVFVDSPGARDSVTVCLHVDRGAESDRLANLATSYRLQGARQVIAYGTRSSERNSAFKSSSLAQLVSWYDWNVLQGVSDAVLTSLMLRDCALRSSPRTRCLAFLGSKERLAFKVRTTAANCCFRDPRFLEACDKPQAVFVTRRGGHFPLSSGNCQASAGVKKSSSANRNSTVSLQTEPLRPCSNGTVLQAVLFRVDQALIDERVFLKNAQVLPPSLAVLSPFAATGAEVHVENSTASNSHGQFLP